MTSRGVCGLWAVGGGLSGLIRAAGGAPQLVWTVLVRGPAGSARQQAHRMRAVNGAVAGGGAEKADGGRGLFVSGMGLGVNCVKVFKCRPHQTLCCWPCKPTTPPAAQQGCLPRLCRCRARVHGPTLEP